MDFTLKRTDNAGTYFESRTGEIYLVNESEIEDMPFGKIMNLISDVPSYKDVGELLNGKYIIPTYQRGYRWNQDNVTQFIEDIYEGNKVLDMSQDLLDRIGNDYKENRFDALKERGAKTEKYCIQPLVVARKHRLNEYSVIDGQQHITTITIILASLKSLGADISRNTSICYQSRPGSADLLNSLFSLKVDDINIETVKNDFLEHFDFSMNIDFEHILDAFSTSVGFFQREKRRFMEDAGFSAENLREYYNYLKFILCECTQVIWYVADMANVFDAETSEKDINERKIFANFNTGKLPLTNAELIKAIFMNPVNFGVYYRAY